MLGLMRASKTAGRYAGRRGGKWFAGQQTVVPASVRCQPAMARRQLTSRARTQTAWYFPTFQQQRVNQRFLSSTKKTSDLPLTPDQQNQGRTMRLMALIFAGGAVATVVGIWSELKTAQVETWAERVYDTFLLLDGVGKFELSDQLKELSKTATGNDDVEGGGEAEADADADAEDVAAGGGGEDAVLTESDDDSVAGPRNHAVDVWKFMMSDPAVRDATSSSGSDVASSLLVVPWEAVRNHAFVTSVADADVDVVDILAELYDKDGRGVHRDDFVALCGSLYILSRDLMGVKDEEVLRSMLTLVALVDGRSTMEQAEALGSTTGEWTRGSVEEQEAARRSIVVSRSALESWLRAMAALGVVKAVNFAKEGTTLHPREVANNTLDEITAKVGNTDSDDSDGESAGPEAAGISGADLTTGVIMPFLEFEMFRKRNVQKFTGHTLLKEMRRRQKYLYKEVEEDEEEDGEKEVVVVQEGQAATSGVDTPAAN